MPNPNFSVTIPENAQELIGLSERALLKHTTDGASSVLSVLDMADMQAKTTLAKIRDAQGAQLNRDKETAFEARNLAMSAESDTPGVEFYLKSARDILLGVYKGKEQKLGDYGYEVSTSRGGGVSVEIPANAEKLIALAARVITKHNNDGAASPIKGLNMADFTAKHQTADAQHKLATQLNRDKEKANKERDHALGIAEGQKVSTEGTVKFYVVSVRDVLLGLYKGREFNLGDWGYDVQFSGGAGAPTGTFKANPSSILKGETSTLEWSISGAAKVEIDNTIGEVPAAGTQTVTPAVTTPYTLKATARNEKTLTTSVTITVANVVPPPVL